MAHDDKASQNQDLIRAVFYGLREHGPVGFRYAAFRLADGVSFVHFAIIDNRDADNPLPSLNSFKRFQQSLRERCAEAPAVTDLSTQGNAK